MKKIILFSFVAMIALSLTFVGCKKNTSATTTDDTASQQQLAADEHSQNVESENSMNEANDAMFSTGIGKTSPIPGATIDTSSIANKIILIHYNGLNADATRTRSGDIKIQLINGSRWKDAGATITITYTNFKVTRLSTGKSLIFDGIVTVINTSGGKVFINPTVIHDALSTGFQITFDDGSIRKWNLSRRRTFTNINGVLSVKEEGTGTADGNSNLLSWGQTRNSENFYTSITTPIVYNTYLSTKCPSKFMSGVKIYKGLSHELTLTLGLDNLGNTVDSTSSNCPTNYKIEWTNAAGNKKSALLTY
jgi:hypothetical protein